MPPLKNARQETFCREMVYRPPGATDMDCYIKSGYSPKSADANTVRMRNIPEVAARIAELQEAEAKKAAKKFGITTERIVEELGRIGFADIRGAVKWGDGVAVRDEEGNSIVVNDVAMIESGSLPPEVSACIKSVKKTRDGVSIEFHDKLSALEKLGKHLGMFKDAAPSAAPPAVQVGVQIFSGVLADIDKDI